MTQPLASFSDTSTNSARLPDVPRVTVAMMVFNSERYLRQSIHSVLKQTMGDFELLVIDDCSTDGSAQILAQITDPRMRVVRPTTRLGLIRSRNLAIELARGPLVAVLDSDDLAMPNRLELQASFMDSNPNVHLVGSRFRVIDVNDRIVQRPLAVADPLTVHWRLMFGNAFCHSTVMYRRDSVRAIGGFRPTVRSSEDFDLFVRFAAAYTVAEIPDVLVDYRTHLTSLTWTEDPNFKDDCLTAIIQSVSLTTGLSIEPDVARALFRDIRRPADSTSVLDEAIATVPRVARAFCERHRVTSAQRTVIIGHAAADLFMLARVNRRRHAAAIRTAIMMVREHRAIGLWLDPMFVARLGYCALNGMWWMMRPRR